MACPSSLTGLVAKADAAAQLVSNPVSLNDVSKFEKLCV